MTPERLAKIREFAANRWLHGFDPQTVRDLLDHIAAQDQRIAELEAGSVVVARGKLLPFPCCGGDAEFAKEEGGGEYIECIAPNCHLSTALVYPAMDEAKPLLVERWNRRAIPDALRAQAGKDGG